ncbi:cold-regulated protein 27 isoform X2 [Argentina anserina]|uniref:cold-regulated protein 27 isoform X2 n=1 Tax=Argentina anserina TaxID=57926 RepID=UPI0021763D92|nr:cold-regulated protein 27 isoform X2 [Potentilla anserina]
MCSTNTWGSQAPTETMSTEWTDEKHSMYLKSMEASFVNQLYNSMDSRGRHTHKGNLSHIKSSKQPQFNSRAASGQFKVLRAGCWQKINFGRGEAESDCGELLANPWILHFRSTSKPKDVESPVVQEQAGAIYEEVDSISKKEITSAPATCLKQSNHFNVSLSHMMHQDMVGGNTEVSDQNFADEDIKEEKAIASCNSKRMKNLVLQASSNDQVVPYQKPADTEDR